MSPLLSSILYLRLVLMLSVFKTIYKKRTNEDLCAENHPWLMPRRGKLKGARVTYRLTQSLAVIAMCYTNKNKL